MFAGAKEIGFLKQTDEVSNIYIRNIGQLLLISTGDAVKIKNDINILRENMKIPGMPQTITSVDNSLEKIVEKLSSFNLKKEDNALKCTEQECLF